jgi:hypothetical protein
MPPGIGLMFHTLSLPGLCSKEEREGKNVTTASSKVSIFGSRYMATANKNYSRLKGLVVCYSGL